MDKIKILLTGGSGTLGKELLKIYDKQNYIFYSPSSSEMNVVNLQECIEYFNKENFDIVVHAAAYTDTKKSQSEFIKVTETNVIGTFNILKCCEEKNIKMVYISTDHVFDGKKGGYCIYDPLNPITNYAKTKTAGEIIVSMYPNSLIIRTSFFGYEFPYDSAFVDQKSTKDYIDIMAPKILDEILSKKIGISHVKSKKRTMYEIAKNRNKNIKKAYRKDSSYVTLEDTSLL
jgi:dTDP-4-dehydrorhamnose reductase